MCTVTWLRRMGSYEVFFNRDERKQRGPELAPRIQRMGETGWIAPADSQAGGTWLAVNQHGLTIGLLNGFQPASSAQAGTRSRGLLVQDLAPSHNLSQLHARLEIADLEPYETFVLVGFAPGREPTIFDWDGTQLRVDSHGDARLPLVSSGVEQDEVRHRRRSLLELYNRDHGSLDRALLLDYHASHEEGPSAFSPCMHREDSETRSLCHVVIDADAVHLAHAPGAPCRTALGEALTLPRA